MQRLYTYDEYMRRIEWMKRAKRDIAISTDIIVGFPGETEDDFNQTLRLLTDVGYDSVFIFKYSKRPNTPALQFEDHIPEEEKTRRFTLLQEHQRAIQMRRNARYVGTTQEVHVEGFNLATGQWIGRTSQNKTLNFNSSELPAPDPGRSLVGEYLDVLVTRASPHSLAGERMTAGGSLPLQ
jgi:tRNA-2-methylthio-N6-dimethylallyladenosine synthase